MYVQANWYPNLRKENVTEIQNAMDAIHNFKHKL
jgi:hypothetical protein